MASFEYDEGQFRLNNGGIKLDGTGDIRLMFVEVGSTAADETSGTEKTATTISGFTTLAEYASASHTAGFSGTGRKALTEALTKETGNRIMFDSTDIIYTALAVSTSGNNIIGALIYQHNTSDADSIPLAYIDLADFNGNGGNVTIQWSATGIISWQL